MDITELLSCGIFNLKSLHCIIVKPKINQFLKLMQLDFFHEGDTQLYLFYMSSFGIKKVYTSNNDLLQDDQPSVTS